MKFIADDGKIFDTMDACEEYEKMNNEGKEIAQLWYNYITMYDETGHMIESSYDFKNNIKSYLDDTANLIAADNTAFLSMDCTSGEWKKIEKYFSNEYGLTLPSYARGFHRYDYEWGQWISLHKDYEEFKKKWAPMGIRF